MLAALWLGGILGTTQPDPLVDGTQAHETKTEIATLAGQILELGTAEPIANARLIPVDGQEALYADDEGRFETSVAAGAHEYIVRAPGFDDATLPVNVEANAKTIVEIYLEPSLSGDPYRTVVGVRPPTAVSRITLERDEIHAAPGTMGDPIRAVTSLPGAAQVAGFLPYLVVRGAAPGNTGYYLDGVRIPVVFHIAVGPSVIHPSLIEAIDFYPGVAPTRLGRFTSGIIEAKTTAPARDRVHGEADLRLTDAGLMVSIPVSRAVRHPCDHPGSRRMRRRQCGMTKGRGSLLFSARYSYTAAILNLVQSTAEIDFWDAQARFDHALGSRTDYTAFAYASFDRIGDVGATEPILRYNFYRLDQRVRHRVRGGGTVLTGVSLGLDQNGVGPRTTSEWRISPRLDLELPTRHPAVRWGIGLDQELQWFRTDAGTTELYSSETESRSILGNDRFVSATGIYADLRIDRHGFEARPGLRLDLYALTGPSPLLDEARATSAAVGIDPRLLLRERVHPRVALTQGIGLSSQPPAPPIPIPGIESSSFERGLQRSIHATAGYQLTLISERLSLVQEAYGSYLLNQQDIDPSSNDLLVLTNGWAYGLETTLRLAPELRMFGWAAYTLAQSIRDHPTRGRVPSPWDQRHILNVVLGYRVTRGLSLGFRLHYNSGRPSSLVFTTDPVMLPSDGRLPGFLQLDARVGYTKSWRKTQLEAYLDLINATYAREDFQCDETGSQIDLLEQEESAETDCQPQGFRYVIPALGVKARW